jgi:hypothetical protein
MQVPPKLYKYQPYKALSIRNLENNQIFFSQPVNFNDPFDCRLSFFKASPTEQNYLKLAKIYSDGICQGKKLPKKYLTNGKINDAFRKEVDAIQEQTIKTRNRQIRYEGGVACFSAKRDDILMWAHYAKGHHGFCLEFDTTYEPFMNARKVHYTSKLPKVNVLKVILHEISPEKQFRRMTTAKYKSWKYEQEWRILLHDERPYTYVPKALTGIYFGSEMKFKHQKNIASIVRGQNPTVKFYRGKRDTESFHLDFELVD